MNSYTEALEFFMSNNIQLTKEQLKSLQEAYSLPRNDKGKIDTDKLREGLDPDCPKGNNKKDKVARGEYFKKKYSNFSKEDEEYLRQKGIKI